MKVLIELDEEVFNEIVSADDDSHLSRAFLKGSYLYFKEALQNGTFISNNATNGDMIKAMYPNIESRLDEKTGIMLIKWADGTMKTFKTIWWNAPYKADKGDEE